MTSFFRGSCPRPRHPGPVNFGRLDRHGGGIPRILLPL